MFKAKLINDRRYYQYRRKVMILSLVPSIPMGLLINFMQFPLWAVIIAFIIYLAAVYSFWYTQKKLQATQGNQNIEITPQEIRLLSKQKNTLQVIQINDSSKIRINEDFGIAGESLNDIGKELKGQSKENFIEVQQGQDTYRFDFVLDSHYMIEQFRKLIKQWESDGILIPKL